MLGGAASTEQLDCEVVLCEELKISGADALRGHTRSHPEHDG